MVKTRYLALAIPLVFVSGEAVADPQLKHIRDNRYETTIRELMENPDWFDKAYVFVFNGVKSGELSPTVRYEVIVRQALDPEKFVEEKVSFKLFSDRPDPRIDSFNQRIRMNRRGAIGYLEANRELLDSISLEAVDTLKRRLAEYNGMERDPNTPISFVPLQIFDPNQPGQRSPELARYIESELMGKSSISHFFGPEEEQEASRFLDEEAIRMGFRPIEDMTPRQAIDFMYAVFNPGVRGHRKDATYEPIGFGQFLVEGGNCTDSGWISTRAWNLMRSRNPSIEDVYWLPTTSYTISGNMSTGHMINTLVSKTGQVTFVDLTRGSGGVDTRTLVIK